MESNKGRGSLTSRYLAAFLAPAVIAGVMQVTWPFFHDNPVSLYLLAVIFCSWYGGLGPGLLSMAISFLLADFFFIEPHFHFWLPPPTYMVRLVIFATVAPFIAVMSELMHRARRRAEANLEVAERAQEALAQTAAIVESSDDAIIGKNLDGIITSWNRGATNLYGYSAEEVIGRPISILIPPDHAHDLPKILNQVKRGEIIDHYETLRIRKDGTQINVSLSVSPIRDARGRIIGAAAIARDITARKQAEEALRESELRYRVLFERAPDGIVVADSEGYFIDANAAICQMIGYSRDELLTLHVSDIVTPAEIPNIDPALAAVSGGEDHRREWQFRRKDGSIFRAEVVATKLPNGNPMGIIRDITERKRAEEALEESESRYRMLFERAPDGIVVADPTGYYIDANAAMCQMTGYTRDELLTLHPSDIVTPAEIPHIEPAFAAVKAGEDYDREWEFRRKDGSTFTAEVVPTLMPNGNPMGMIRDITERKRAKDALRDSEEKFSKAFHSNPAILVLSTLDGKSVDFNQAYVDLVGLPREEMLGKGTVDLRMFEFEERQRLLEVIKQAGGTLRNFETVMRLGDGSVRTMLMSVDLISLVGVPHRLTTLLDITERKQAEERLRATTEQLRALSARIQSAKEEEGTRIAREIHDELGAALTCLRWDLESFDKVISESGDQSHLQALRERIEAMLGLTETTIETVKRISSELRPSVLDDLGLMEAIEWQAQQFQDRTGIICQYDCALENPDLSREQSTAVFRIFQEALTNILRHAQATSVNIQMNEENGEFVLVISDNGRGITENEKSRPQSLGLLGMRERAQLTGGNFNVARIDGTGTVVTVRIPISG